MYLAHYGVKGMHWGIRRYQNYDGTLIKSAKRLGNYYKTKATGELKSMGSIGKNIGDAVTGKDSIKKAFNDTKSDISKNSKKTQKVYNTLSKGEKAVTYMVTAGSMLIPIGGIGTVGAVKANKIAVNGLVKNDTQLAKNAFSEATKSRELASEIMDTADKMRIRNNGRIADHIKVQMDSSNNLRKKADEAFDRFAYHEKRAQNKNYSLSDKTRYLKERSQDIRREKKNINDQIRMAKEELKNPIPKVSPQPYVIKNHILELEKKKKNLKF